MPLTHLRYDIDSAYGCYDLVLTDGTLHQFNSYMRINRNRLDISTTISPVGVHEYLTLTYPSPLEIANPAAWFTLFWRLHESEHILW